ncbi:hypothetical protein [Cellulophaga baltica]
MYVLTKDKNNTIWVGTSGQHLNRYNPEREILNVFLSLTTSPTS